MRVFVAINLSDDARAAVAAVQEDVARMIRGSARLVQPEHLHLTLAFVGSFPADRVSQLVARLTEDVPEPDFEIAFGGFGVFPERGAPRILWLGVIRGEQETVSVQRRVAERLLAVGVEPERRPFHPHLTLARWRDSRSSDRPRGLSRDSFVTAMPVQGVTLYESRPTSSGPRYAALTQARLRADMSRG